MLIEIALLTGAGLYLKKRPKKKNLAQSITTISTTASPNKPVASGVFGAGRLLKDITAAMAAEGRRELQVDIDPKIIASIDKERLKANRRMKLAATAMGLALLGSIYPLFSVIGVVGVLYLSRGMFLRALKDIRLRHYLSSNLVGLLLTLGMLASGQLVLATLAAVMGSFFAKLIDRVEDNTQRQLISTFVEHPEHVWVLKNGAEIQLEFSTVQINDIVVVNAGEVIPVDGTIQSGIASIDQHILTGESQPVEKSVGDQVFASTLLLSGRINILVTTAGQETTAAKIGTLLGYTQSYKDTLITRGRKISDRFIPFTVGISALTLPLLGLNAATAVLWSGTGATMGILGPISVLVYSQILARHGILVKDGRALESLRQVNTIVFDKTGTLTLEQPTVGRIHSFRGQSENTILRYAAAAEYRQPHPIAKAILAKAAKRQLELPALDEASYQVGYGIQVIVEEQVVHVGSARYLEHEGIVLAESVGTIRKQAEQESHSLIYVSINRKLAGVLELIPTIRPEAKSVIGYLKKRGFKLAIISGDHEEPTRRMAEAFGIEHYFAETLPENKARLVEQLREQGDFVCFIGDGINDAIALKAAQVSVSLKGASTVATDTAHIIFMDGTLKHLEQLFRYMDEFEVTMKNNLITSIAPGVISIGGIYMAHFGVAAAMSLSYLGCFVGLCNSLKPLLRYQEDLK